MSFAIRKGEFLSQYMVWKQNLMFLYFPLKNRCKIYKSHTSTRRIDTHMLNKETGESDKVNLRQINDLSGYISYHSQLKYS